MTCPKTNVRSCDEAIAMTDEQTTLGGLASRVKLTLGLAGATALAAGLALGWSSGDGLRYFLHSYLLNYCYVLSIALGALFFVALQHAARAGWSVTVRRLAELLAAPMPLLAVLSLPIIVPALAGDGRLYLWADARAVAADELLRHKAPYFNPFFFALRWAGYFAVWWLLARFFLRRSLEQDHSGDPALTLRMERLSGPALLLLFCTVSFAAFDWLMSLAPDWSSTIFGVYYFAGAVVGFLAALILLALLLQAGGRLQASVTVEHYHDLGKLLFAFVIFWGYIAFSQYLLIWYGDIPEETRWYLVRQTGGWVTVSLLLLFVHLPVPFFGLLSREAKRRKALLGFWAAWMLAAHWLDLYWLVMPSVSPAAPPLGVVDLCCLLGIAGLYLAGVARAAEGVALAPLRDPRLAESLAFENS
jgi:hypothetical protein